MAMLFWTPANEASDRPGCYCKMLELEQKYTAYQARKRPICPVRCSKAETLRRLISLILYHSFLSPPSSGRKGVKWFHWCLVLRRFLSTVTWETLDVELEDGRWPWRLMATRYKSLHTMVLNYKRCGSLSNFNLMISENVSLQLSLLERQKWV